MATPVAVSIDPDKLARALAVLNSGNSASNTADALQILLKAIQNP